MTPTDELIAAPVGEWETTGEQRKAAERHWPVLNSVEFKDECGDGFWLRLLRDLDLALASLSAERDQNKRLVEALKGARGWARAALENENNDDEVTLARIVRDIDATLAQPEEQR